MRIFLCAGIFVLTALVQNVFAGEGETQVYQLEAIQVSARADAQEFDIEPEKTTISVDKYQSIGSVQNVGDIVKDLVIMDYRGATDLVPDDDTLYMRGFSSKRFVTSLDGATIRKTGGRRSSHIVDYALLPPFLVETVEVLPGPHSALYPGKSIGGGLNFVTRKPVRYDTLKPDVKMSADYSTYDTRNVSTSLQGGAGNFTYDLGYQKYATNGYLRHGDVDIDTYFGRFSYVLPNDGYISFTASYADADRERPTVNDPGDPESNWDSSYPGLKKAGRIYYQWQDPTWDKISPNYRLNINFPSPVGTWTATAHYGEENRDNSLMEWVDTSDPSKGIRDGSFDTEWHQQGGRVANEFQLADNHTTTIGGELEQCYDGYGDVPGWGNSVTAHDDKKRIEIISGFAQHEWQVMPRLKMTAGLRYEDTTVWVSNHSSRTGEIYITDRDMWIKRNWCQVLPKSFLTYDLDDLAAGLRDTSISVGVSKIWRAPDYHGDYNPQGRPTGAWLDPEHGVGYDLVLNRRLVGDIKMNVNYAYYKIKDYIATNSDYAHYWPKSGVKVEEGLEYLDYKINLDEVVRQGIEVQLDGHLTDNLSFVLGYAWQDFENQGREPSGETELDDRADNFFTARLTWQISPATSVTFNYEYQDEQVVKTSTETAPDVYEFEDIPIDSFDIAGISVTHKLFDEFQGLRNCRLRLYCHNLFDEEYENTSGYPGTDLTVGTGISVEF